MKARLTKTAVEALERGSRDIYAWDDRVAGFGVKVTPKGARIYVLKYRAGRLQRWMTLGRHGEMTAEQARAKADKASLALTHTREEAVRQIVVAANGLRTSLSAYNAATSLTAAAETTFEASLTAYRNGVGSITDATVAESQLLQAKNASTDAYSATLSAAATLALAVGALGSAPQ